MNLFLSLIFPAVLAGCSKESDYDSGSLSNEVYCDTDCTYSKVCPDKAENGWVLVTNDDESVLRSLINSSRCMFGEEITIEYNDEVIEDCWDLVEGDRNGSLFWETRFDTCEYL